MTDIGFDVRRVNGDALELQAAEARLAVRSARGGDEDAGQLHPARADARPLRPGHPAEPRWRSDRAAAGRLARRPPWSALGATIDYRNGYYFAAAPADGLRGATIDFPTVTVMGTENAMLAATLARGTTVIDNAALEPEVDDLDRDAVLDGRAHRAHRRASDRDRGRRAPARAPSTGHGRSARGGDVRHRRRHHRAARSRCSGIDPAHLGAFLEVCDRMGSPTRPMPPAPACASAAADGHASGRRPDRAVSGLRHRLPGAAVRAA